MNSWLSNKTISCLGDSITQGVGNNDISWVDYLKDLIDAKKINKYGVAGSRIAKDNERQDSFLDRMQDIDPESDIIVIFGGVNDFNHAHPLADETSLDPETFYGALNLLLTSLQNRFPTADFLLMTPMKSSDFKGYPNWKEKNSAGLTLKDYRDAILKTAENHSILVLDLYAESGLTPDLAEIKKNMLPDGLHPSKEGYLKIARKTAHTLLYRL